MSETKFTIDDWWDAVEQLKKWQSIEKDEREKYEKSTETTEYGRAVTPPSLREAMSAVVAWRNRAQLIEAYIEEHNY